MLNRHIKLLDDPRSGSRSARGECAELIRFMGADVVNPGRSVVSPGQCGRGRRGGQNFVTTSPRQKPCWRKRGGSIRLEISSQEG